MRRAWLLLTGMALAPLSVLAQTMDFSKVEILTEKLGPNVYMLSGSSGLDPSHEDAAGGRIHLNAFCAIKIKSDLVRVGARPDNKVVFQIAALAVIDQVDAGIDLGVGDAAEGWDVGYPFLFVVAAEVIVMPRSFSCSIQSIVAPPSWTSPIR